MLLLGQIFLVVGSLLRVFIIGMFFFYSREVSADQEVVRRRPHVQMEGHRPGSHPVRDAHHHEGHVMARRHRNGIPLRWRHQSRPHAW